MEPEHSLCALLTVGAPSAGAPRRLRPKDDPPGFNQNLFNVIGLAGGAFAIDPSTWNAVYLFVRGALLFSQQYLIPDIARCGGAGPAIRRAGARTDVDGFVFDGTAQCAREHRARAEHDRQPRRAHVHNVARNYRYAGPARAIDPDNADRYLRRDVGCHRHYGRRRGVSLRQLPNQCTANWIANSLFTCRRVGEVDRSRVVLGCHERLPADSPRWDRAHRQTNSCPERSQS